MRGLAIRLAILVGIVAVVLVLRPYLSGNASQLNVGDCFDLPAGAEDTVDDVQHHPCTDSHFAEVVFVGDYSPSGGTYPDDDAFQQFFLDQCVPAYNAYTGGDILTSADMDMGFFYPTSDGWGKGDKKITCYAHQAADNTMLTKSIKK